MFWPFQAVNRHSEASETSPRALAHLPPVQGLTFAVQVRSQILVQDQGLLSPSVLDTKISFHKHKDQEQTLFPDMYKTKIILNHVLDKLRKD